MASVFTVHLGSVSNAPAGDATLFTADSSNIWVLIDVVWSNGTTSVQQAQVYLQDPGALQYPVLREPQAAELTSIHWTGRQVIPAGWAVRGYGGAGAWTAIATGWKLDL